MLTEALAGRHPRDLIARGEQRNLVDAMVRSLGRIASAFAPGPVIYRATDFRTNEFRGLVGGDRYEPIEHNPMIGYRGCYRYIKEGVRTGKRNTDGQPPLTTVAETDERRAAEVASAALPDVLARLGTSTDGLSSGQAR